VDHEVLKEVLERKIKDPDLLWLVNLIIDNSNQQEEINNYFPGDDLFTPFRRRRGIPIGNQTSQFFSNVYLDPLDHFVKEKLRFKGYVRYVDDFLLFANNKTELRDARNLISKFLNDYRLRLHSKKNTISPVNNGIRFLGYRVFPSHRLLPKENVRRFLRRVKQMQKEYSAGVTSFLSIQQKLMSWVGHALNANTCELRKRLFSKIRFQRAARN
jgi:retron-type reverse transcriptase